MKKITFIFFIFIFLSISTISFSQTADGTFRLRSLKISKTIFQKQKDIYSSVRSSANLNELKANETIVGFQIFNFSTKNYEYKECLFLCEGQKCKVFADNSCIEKAKENVSLVVSNFDNKIYPNVCSWFGLPVIPKNLYLPDDKIYIVLTSKLGNYSEGYVAGYFDHRDLSEIGGNAKPVLFMDAINSDISDYNNKLNNFYRTLAHEFQHLVNYSIRLSMGKAEQERWLDEAFSMFAEYIYSGTVGINNERIPPSPHLVEYLKKPSVDLTNNSDKLWFTESELYKQYGAAFVFMAYLTEKYGGDNETLQKLFIKELVRETRTGSNGINDILYKTNKKCDEIIFDINMALALNNNELNSGLWGFENKQAIFGSASLLIPLSQNHISQSGDIYILPNTFKENTTCLNENNIFSICPIEIPVFQNKNIIAIKKK